MSDIKIGVIAEGKTDVILIEGILKKIFAQYPITVVSISPTENEINLLDKKCEGFGWRSVFVICSELQKRIEMQQIIGNVFDFIVIQIDGDVLLASYEDIGVNTDPNILGRLNYDSSLSISENCNYLEENVILRHWIKNVPDIPIIFCVPFINSDIWAAYILYDNQRNDLAESTTKKNLNTVICTRYNGKRLANHKSNGKLKKIVSSYITTIELLDRQLWKELTQKFSQAQKFNDKINTALYALKGNQYEL